jgi:hypothetical protein
MDQPARLGGLICFTVMGMRFCGLKRIFDFNFNVINKMP